MPTTPRSGVPAPLMLFLFFGAASERKRRNARLLLHIPADSDGVKVLSCGRPSGVFCVFCVFYVRRHSWQTRPGTGRYTVFSALCTRCIFRFGACLPYSAWCILCISGLISTGIRDKIISSCKDSTIPQSLFRDLPNSGEYMRPHKNGSCPAFKMGRLRVFLCPG